MLCEGNLHSIYHFCYCKRVFPPEWSWRGRLAAAEGLLCADFPCAWNGARLFWTSPQVLHMYSRRAARRSWTCFTCRFKASIRLSFRPQGEHSCLLITKNWIARHFRINGVESTSSCKITRCINDGFTVRQVLLSGSGSKLRQQTRTPNDGFLLNTLKTFRLSRVLSDI